MDGGKAARFWLHPVSSLVTFPTSPCVYDKRDGHHTHVVYRTQCHIYIYIYGGGVFLKGLPCRMSVRASPHLHVVFESWHQHTSTGHWAKLPFSLSSKASSCVKTKDGSESPLFKKPFCWGECVFHYGSILLTAHRSPDTKQQPKPGSSGITDERRWTVSGKVPWKTFNVFYISVSELSGNTWITQCQPNTA